VHADRRLTWSAAIAVVALITLFSTAAPVVAITTSAATTTRVPVLMYHRIVEDPPLGSRFPDLYLTPGAFDLELGALWARGWHTITAAALGEAIRARSAVPTGTFVISVDDGHSDGYTTAWPIMQKYGFVGTFYVVPGHIGRPGFLTWGMAATLAQAGNEIANHTMDHVSLPSYHGAALVAQIDDAALAIRTQLATRGVTTTVQTFAYPYGHASVEAMQLLASRGYTLAVTTVHGSGSILGSEPLHYPRIRVSRGENLKAFLANLGRVTLIDRQGAPIAASRPPAASATAPSSVGAFAAAPHAASPDPAVGAPLPAPADAPRLASERPGTSTSTEELLAVGGIGALFVLLVTGAATLRWRRR
jgi:peptidoglycan/xylan/chitin deacetylase (PgdA/CDA1 family)